MPGEGELELSLEFSLADLLFLIIIKIGFSLESFPKITLCSEEKKKKFKKKKKSLIKKKKIFF